MKNALIVFTALFMTGYLFTSATAKETPTIDEIDALLNKVSKNIQSAGEATKMAQTMNAKMVESKVAEKEALKADVAKAEAKVEKFATTMMAMGIDTAIVSSEATLKGPAYDKFLEYQKNGGIEDFEYFRLYIYK